MSLALHKYKYKYKYKCKVGKPSVSVYVTGKASYTSKTLLIFSLQGLKYIILGIGWPSVFWHYTINNTNKITNTSVTASTATALLRTVGHFILWVGGPSISIDSGTNTNTAYYPVGGPGPSMSLKSHRTYLVSNRLVSERARTHPPVGLLSVVTCTIEKAPYSNT